MAGKLPTLAPKSLAEQVYDVVRDAIARGEFSPGQLLSVSEISEQMNVSRTPAREALLKLEEQGIVKMERNKGARIIVTTASDLQELFSIRLLLEVPTAFQAAKVATEKDIENLKYHLDAVATGYRATSEEIRAHMEPDVQFHKAIAKIAGSQRLVGILDGLFDQQLTADGSSHGHTRGTEELITDHIEIFTAIERRDPESAMLAMRSHLIDSSKAISKKECGEVIIEAGLTDIFHLFEKRRNDT